MVTLPGGRYISRRFGRGAFSLIHAANNWSVPVTLHVPYTLHHVDGLFHWFRRFDFQEPQHLMVGWCFFFKSWETGLSGE